MDMFAVANQLQQDVATLRGALAASQAATFQAAPDPEVLYEPETPKDSSMISCTFERVAILKTVRICSNCAAGTSVDWFRQQSVQGTQVSLDFLSTVCIYTRPTVNAPSTQRTTMRCSDAGLEKENTEAEAMLMGAEAMQQHLNALECILYAACC